MVKKEIRFKGIIDVGIIALSHCKNPAQKSSLIFFSKVLKLEIPCLIPVSTIVGAYHVMTNYLKVPPKDVKNALINTLQFKRSIFIEDISKDLAKRALDLAEKSRFESWDGYLISLMEQKNISIVYTLDISDFSKLDWITAINPLDEKEYHEYQQWLINLRAKRIKE